MRAILADLLESGKDVLFVGADAGPTATHALALAFQQSASIAETITLVEVSKEAEYRKQTGVMWCYTASARTLPTDVLTKFPIRVSIREGKIVGLLKYKEGIA